MTMNLKEIRKANGISQMKLARKVGVSLLTIQLWENGVSNPNKDNEEKLKKVLQELKNKGE